MPILFYIVIFDPVSHVIDTVSSHISLSASIFFLFTSCLYLLSHHARINSSFQYISMSASVLQMHPK